MRRSRFPRVRIMIAVVLIVVLGPYVFSRLASPFRRIRVIEAKANVAAVGPSTGRLSIACYNIAHGRGLSKTNWSKDTKSDRIDRLDAIADLLQQTGATVIVLNEVDFDSSWSHSVNQAEYLANRLGFSYRIEERNLDFRVLFWTWRFGNAILSQHPVRETELVDLPSYSTWESLLAGKKRGVVTTVEFGVEESVRVLATHLSHRSERVRVESAQLINSIADECDLPLIIAGDLNSTPPDFPGSNSDEHGQNAIATLDRGGILQRLPNSVPVPSDRLTFHSTEPNRVIDWVLIPRNAKYDKYEVIPSELSDHRPIMAEISFR